MHHPQIRTPVIQPAASAYIIAFKPASACNSLTLKIALDYCGCTLSFVELAVLFCCGGAFCMAMRLCKSMQQIFITLSIRGAQCSAKYIYGQCTHPSLIPILFAVFLDMHRRLSLPHCLNSSRSKIASRNCNSLQEFIQSSSIDCEQRCYIFLLCSSP